jgi:HD-GYP domain-containing protein (c-di-GMP phosphodiesterase class II)
MDKEMNRTHHQDELSALNGRLTLNQKLEIIHGTVKKRFPGTSRIAVALYEQKSDVLKTYLASSGSEEPLVRYESQLDDAPTLRELMRSRTSRVIHDLSIFRDSVHEHTRKILEEGYQSSYTVPIVFKDVFYGFLFFDSFERSYFTDDVTVELDVFSHLISSIVADEIRTIQILGAVLTTANQMVHQRDPETAAHLNRMSHFSRLIAQELAATGKYNFTDEYIELIFLFSALHDIGKIGVPDAVLLKPAKLNSTEFDIMKTHTIEGAHFINKMIGNFGLESLPDVQMLWNIAQFHHEKLNGTGYPYGLKGDEIPVEARIVAVADVFDALTTRRPYKLAKTNEEAFEILKSMASTELDKDCVEALIRKRDKLKTIQMQFVQFAHASCLPPS